MSPVLALDIGGTKLAAGIVDEAGKVLIQDAAPTNGKGTDEALFADLIALCDRVLVTSGFGTTDLQGIGVGCGGPMRYPEGKVSPLNIDAWNEFPLRARLQERYGLRTIVDNDAKALAIGEYVYGAGQGARCLMAMVVSTGVGGGIVEAGNLIHGASGNAGHIGHVIAYLDGPPCGCGGHGCVEAVASGTGLRNRARRALKRGVKTDLPPSPEAIDIAAAARRGDAYSQRLMREAGIAVARGIAAAAVLADIDKVVIGGSIALQASDLLMPPLRQELAKRLRIGFCRDIEVVLSTLGVTAALAGAAALVSS